MQFISKTSAEGTLIVEKFIDKQWIDGQYSNLDYPGFRPIEMKKVLLEEQNNYCCYCMKLLDNNSETTMEHIIPRSVADQIEMDKYFLYPVLSDNIMLHEVFRASTVKLVMPKYPHHLAYYNLVASCKGTIISEIANPNDRTSKFCNGFRGDNYIIPMFYDENVAEKIFYTRGGMVIPIDEWEITVENINLNDNTLEKIRHIWSAFGIHDVAKIEQANNEDERRELLTDALMKPGFVSEANLLIETYVIEVFWNSLMQYKWFYNYFRR